MFGNVIRRAQQDAVAFIPPDAKILIVGGGTGWIIEEISKQHSSGLAITYIDKSEKMVALSRTRHTGTNSVDYLSGAIEDLPLPIETFDIVFTPFILDCLSEPLLGSVIGKLDHCLKPGGLWLFADFHLSANSMLWQRMLLKLMYLFFTLTTSIGATRLAPVDHYFSGYSGLAAKKYLVGFIVMRVMQKW